MLCRSIQKIEKIFVVLVAATHRRWDQGSSGSYSPPDRLRSPATRTSKRRGSSGSYSPPDRLRSAV